MTSRGKFGILRTDTADGGGTTTELTENIFMSDYTIAEAPPSKQESQRRSRWADLFNECRVNPGEWRRIKEPLKRSTAAQIASDIRNVHRREAMKTRLRGFLPDDKWEAVWSNSPDDSNMDNFYIWLRYVGPVK